MIISHISENVVMKTCSVLSVPMKTDFEWAGGKKKKQNKQTAYFQYLLNVA